MLWRCLVSRGHQVNGIGLMNVPAIGIFDAGVRDFASSLLKFGPPFFAAFGKMDTPFSSELAMVLPASGPLLVSLGK